MSAGAAFVVARPEILAETDESFQIRVSTNVLRSVSQRRYRTNELEKYAFTDAAAIAERELQKAHITHVISVPWNSITN